MQESQKAVTRDMVECEGLPIGWEYSSIPYFGRDHNKEFIPSYIELDRKLLLNDILKG